MNSYSRLQTNFMRDLKLYIVVLIAMIAYAKIGYSQAEYKPMTFASPDASAFTRYGQVPVSMYTGVPQISIPLYTVVEGEIEVPISISYHASGIKVEDKASSIGLGWSLNAGGMITREVRGIPDEDMGGFRDKFTRDSINEIIKNYLPLYQKQSLLDEPLLGMDFTDAQSAFIFHAVNSQEYDTESDIYNFSLTNASGKFYIQNDGKATTMPYQNINISYDNDVFNHKVN